MISDSPEKGGESEEQKSKKVREKGNIAVWLTSSLICYILPFIFTIVRDLLSNKVIDWNGMIIRGELILSSFTLLIPTFLNYYNVMDKEDRWLFCGMLVTALFELSTYVSIRALNTCNSLWVIIFSVISIIITIVLSRIGERRVNRLTTTI